MYIVEFYKDRYGNEPVVDYLKGLLLKKDKNSKIKAKKIQEYINNLSLYGTFIGEPVVKHIEDDLWELRPSGDRVLFAVLHKGKFLLLHAFTKTTQKTPEREIQKARAEYKDFIERG